MVKMEKVPPLTCKKCGGTYVIMTDNGPECDTCDQKQIQFEELTEEVEFRIYQMDEIRRNNL
jgi:hypothetical protein